MAEENHIHSRALVWLRRDIRCFDHRAWSEAEKLAREITIVFVFDTTILSKLEKNDRRVTFIFDSLLELQEKLQGKGSSLLIRYGDPKEEIPKLCSELKAEALFVNRDYEPYAKQRDLFVQNILENKGIQFYSFKDHVIFEDFEVKTLNGENFKVFTPYSRAWRAKLNKESFLEAKVKMKNLSPTIEIKKHNQKLSLENAGFIRNESFLKAGMTGAKDQLKAFQKHIQHYDEGRNFPANTQGTSQLSTHLRFGTLSIREVIRETSGRDKGTQTWHSELIWRDFFQTLMSANPRLAHEAFQLKYKTLEWPGSQKHFQAWCEGQTGYPIVDAAMRHFKQTGWMHNRLRMIVASFLTKDLLCSWQWGEKYFAENLLDFDLAANNGGWQWASSVGCDAQPYFRIFNPTLQSERFDPEGEFIRTHIPELKDMPTKFLHAPWKSGVKTSYVLPIVDHAAQKDKVLKLFKTA